MPPAGTAVDPLTKRFPRPIALASSPAEAYEQRDCDGCDDEQDKANRQTDFLAELFTARGGGRGRGVRGVLGGSGGKESEGGAGEGFGVLVFLVHYECEGEVGGMLAFEPEGRHVEEDRALRIGGIEG